VVPAGCGGARAAWGSACAVQCAAGFAPAAAVVLTCSTGGSWGPPTACAQALSPQFFCFVIFDSLFRIPPFCANLWTLAYFGLLDDSLCSGATISPCHGDWFIAMTLHIPDPSPISGSTLACKSTGSDYRLETGPTKPLPAALRPFHRHQLLRRRLRRHRHRLLRPVRRHGSALRLRPPHVRPRRRLDRRRRLLPLSHSSSGRLRELLRAELRRGGPAAVLPYSYGGVWGGDGAGAGGRGGSGGAERCRDSERAGGGPDAHAVGLQVLRLPVSLV
jgi:hypothetical protein